MDSDLLDWIKDIIQWFLPYLRPSNQEPLQFDGSDAFCAFYSKFPEWKEIMIRHSNEDLVYNFVTNYCKSFPQISPLFHAVKFQDPESIEFIKMVIDDPSINLDEVEQDGGNTIFHYIINDSEMMELFTRRLILDSNDSKVLKIQNDDLETPIDKLEFKKSEEFFSKFPEWREIFKDLSEDYEGFRLVFKFIMKWYGDHVNLNSPIFHAVIQAHIPTTWPYWGYDSNNIELIKDHYNDIKLIKLIASHKLINLYEVDTELSKDTIFHIVCRSEMTKKYLWPLFIERIIEDPKLLNVQNEVLETPVDILIHHRSIKRLEFLLNNEDLDEAFEFQDNKGQTYLHKAINARLPSVVVRLLGKKVNVNVQDHKGRTALHYACKSDTNTSYEAVKFLIEKEETDINAKDQDQKTALHYACQASSHEAVKFLIEIEETDINAKDQDKKTALHYACQASSYEAVKFLIKKEETDINAKDRDQKTALHYACQASSPEIITLFLTYHEERNINLSEEDNEGKEPINILSIREKSNPRLKEALLDVRLLMQARVQIYATDATLPRENQDICADENQDILDDLDYIHCETDESSSESD